VDLENVYSSIRPACRGILFAQQAARRRGGDVILRHPSHLVSRVLDITGLRDAFIIDS
jgi:anti-anti-sigma regulatory factor